MTHSFFFHDNIEVMDPVNRPEILHQVSIFKVDNECKELGNELNFNMLHGRLFLRLRELLFIKSSILEQILVFAKYIDMHETNRKSQRLLSITKLYLYNFYLLKSLFYIVKLGFTGVYIIFLISAQKHRL